MSVPSSGERASSLCALMSSSSARPVPLSAPTLRPSSRACDLEQRHDAVRGLGERRPLEFARLAASVREHARHQLLEARQKGLGLHAPKHLVEHQVPGVVGGVRGHEHRRAGVRLAVVGGAEPGHVGGHDDEPMAKQRLPYSGVLEQALDVRSDRHAAQGVGCRRALVGLLIGQQRGEREGAERGARDRQCGHARCR